MIIYRYEFPDGGGPFCTKDGRKRDDPNIWFNDDTLYGCKSIEELKLWFDKRNINYSCYILTKYYGELVKEGQDEILIKKSTARKMFDKN